MTRIAERLGISLFPSQRYVLDVALEVLPDGSWAFEDVWDTEPRRSGKTFKARPLVVHRGIMPGEPRGIWMTAQKREKAVLRFEDIAKPLELGPMRREVRRLRSRAAERLEFLLTGSVFRPFAPNNEEEMHGEDPDLVLVDEWWSFDLADKAMIEEGYKPAFSVKSGQAWLMSTAGTEESSWMNEGVAQGRQAVLDGVTRGLAYFDWSIPDELGGTPVEKLPDDVLLQLVWDHHPRRDHGLRRGYLEDELRKSRPRFLRAYGNRTQEARLDGCVPADVWERAEASALIPEDARVGLGVGVDELGRESTIFAGWRDPVSGVAVVELVAQAAGSGWVAPRLASLDRRWDVGAVALHSTGPARAAGDTAARAGVPVLRVTTSDVAAAGTQFLEALEDERVRHDGRRGPELTEAMRAARINRLKAGSTVEPAGTRPVSAMEAAILAMWAADHLPVVEDPLPEFAIY